MNSRNKQGKRESKIGKGTKKTSKEVIKRIRK